MDFSKFRHESDSRYCFSISPNEVLVRFAIAKDVHLEKAFLLYGDTSTFVKKQTRIRMERKHEDEFFFYYEATMSSSIPRFFYIFHVIENGCDFFLSESGVSSSYMFNLAFLSAYQYIGENRNDFSLPFPSWQGRLVYQVFPERFACHGNPQEKQYVNEPWDKANLKGNHRAFLGGDLIGLCDKLDYLVSLGVGVLYMTPIHPSPSNHKYDVLDYFDVDPSFGGKEALRNLVEKAHSLGIKVMMDLVFNHTSFEHPFFKDVRQKGKASEYWDWFFIDGDKPSAHPLNYRCFSFVPWMPKLDTNNPKVRKYLVSVGKFWVEEFHIDGFRLDVAEGVSHDFWIRFKIALKDIDPDIILIGENWHNSESYLGPDQLDGVMNYPFLSVVSGYVLGITDAETTRMRLEGLLLRYKDGQNHMMLNILSSHDIQRVMNLCKKDKDLVLLAYAMQMFHPGFPMVYYGEEVFMEGGADPDHRRGLEWNKAEAPDYYANTFRNLMLLRQHEELRRGETKIENAGGLLKITRQIGGACIALYLNRSLEPLALPKLGEELLSNRAAGGRVYPKGFLVQKE